MKQKRINGSFHAGLFLFAFLACAKNENTYRKESGPEKIVRIAYYCMSNVKYKGDCIDFVTDVFIRAGYSSPFNIKPSNFPNYALCKEIHRGDWIVFMNAFSNGGNLIRTDHCAIF